MFYPFSILTLFFKTKGVPFLKTPISYNRKAYNRAALEEKRRPMLCSEAPGYLRLALIRVEAVVVVNVLVCLLVDWRVVRQVVTFVVIFRVFVVLLAGGRHWEIRGEQGPR